MYIKFHESNLSSQHHFIFNSFNLRNDVLFELFDSYVLMKVTNYTILSDSGICDFVNDFFTTVKDDSVSKVLKHHTFADNS
jgi:hypothetical protein